MSSFDNSAIRREVSLTQALERRARAASRRRLLLDMGCGLLVAIIMAVWQPAGWLIFLSAALAFVAFGVWGTADRELGAARLAAGGPGVRALIAARVAAVTLGALAVFTLLFSIVGVAMGTWIS